MTPQKKANIVLTALCVLLTAGIVWLSLKQGTAPKKNPHSNTDDSIKKARAVIKPKTAPWRYIIIHHSATNGGSSKAFDRHHRRRNMVNGLAYHFVIGNGNGVTDGLVEIGPRWEKQLPGGHMKNEDLNKIGIGICLVGNFEKKLPSKKQLESLTHLVKKLSKTYTIAPDHVVRHIDLGQSVCPGKRFPWKKFKDALKTP